MNPGKWNEYMYFYNGNSGILGEKAECSFVGVDPTTFHLLVQVIYIVELHGRLEVQLTNVPLNSSKWFMFAVLNN